MAMLALRYDLRSPSGWGPASHAELYAACLDQCAWGDERGFDAVVISEHHGSDDGYLPAPVTMAAAIAGRTKRIMINIAAILVPLHDPVRLAEQLAVADLASGGRVSFVAGIGYRPVEFEMAGVDKKRRGKLVEEYIGVMRQAWTGEPFEWRGRTIVATPKPMTQPHPLIMIGGSGEIAARRAARLRAPFFPAIGDPKLAEIYNEECEKVGYTEGFVNLPAGPGFVHVAEDPEAAWVKIGPHALHEANVYESWQTPDQRSQVDVHASTIDEVRQSGVYKVVTPDECVELASELGDFGTLLFHPLMGGIPPDLAWESLELFEAKVLPRLRG
jgi:alkanesulfonate monooxygenase SsuD/methylene tetrahydromethanopterin reductase-like flavin-dependent oxidoreductase (luciferase family)